jgi:probable rRNA maturation factor
VETDPEAIREMQTCQSVPVHKARKVEPFVRHSARAMLTVLNLRGVELSILLVADPRMRKLNRNWRNLDRVTNVLSFPQLEPEQVEDLTEGQRPANVPSGKPVLLGDVVLAPVTVARRAGGCRAFWPQLKQTLAHGILHLCGHDHRRTAERRRMRSAESRLLRKT